MKQALFILVCGVFTSGFAFCDLLDESSSGFVSQRGGFTGSSLVADKVSDVRQLPDDAWVTIKGRIIKRLTDDEYMFQDLNGETMIVEIDSKYWNGVNVNTNDVVELSGEVDKEMFKPLKLEIKSVRKVQPATNNQGGGFVESSKK